MLKQFVGSLAVAVMLTGVALAGPFEYGVTAYERRDYATAVRLWQPLAEQGDARAQAILGSMYGEGRGVRRDYAQAVKWFRLAAEQGNATAQFNLGVLYFGGMGVSQNDAEAVKWYQLAADQGNSIAQFNLGVMYDGGYGVPQDNVLAYMWLSVSTAARSSDAARTFRRMVASHMTPDQIAEAQRLAREWRPVAKH